MSSARGGLRLLVERDGGSPLTADATFDLMTYRLDRGTYERIACGQAMGEDFSPTSFTHDEMHAYWIVGKQIYRAPLPPR